MEFLEEKLIECPYCGEPISILIDEQDAGDEYTEDCQVCCKPIVFFTTMDLECGLQVTVRTENDTF